VGRVRRQDGVEDARPARSARELPRRRGGGTVRPARLGRRAAAPARPAAQRGRRAVGGVSNRPAQGAARLPEPGGRAGGPAAELATVGGALMATQGWPFLIAAGRRRDY